LSVSYLPNETEYHIIDVKTYGCSVLISATVNRRFQTWTNLWQSPGWQWCLDAFLFRRC
jgi:hypothetical protein